MSSQNSPRKESFGPINQPAKPALLDLLSNNQIPSIFPISLIFYRFKETRE